MKYELRRVLKGGALPPSDKPLQDDTVVGFQCGIVEMGKPFVLLAPPRDTGDVRTITTPPITEFTNSKEGLRFVTRSGSVYILREVEEDSVVQ